MVHWGSRRKSKRLMSFKIKTKRVSPKLNRMTTIRMNKKKIWSKTNKLKRNSTWKNSQPNNKKFSTKNQDPSVNIWSTMWYLILQRDFCKYAKTSQKIRLISWLDSSKEKTWKSIVDFYPLTQLILSFFLIIRKVDSKLPSFNKSLL
jgi:hypothetical protein